MIKAKFTIGFTNGKTTIIEQQLEADAMESIMTVMQESMTEGKSGVIAFVKDDDEVTFIRCDQVSLFKAKVIDRGVKNEKV